MFSYLNQIKKLQFAMFLLVGLSVFVWISTKEKTREMDIKTRGEVKERSRLAHHKQNRGESNLRTRSQNSNTLFPSPEKTSIELASKQFEAQKLALTAVLDQELLTLLKTAKDHERLFVLTEMETRNDPEIINFLIENIYNIQSPIQIRRASQCELEERFPVCLTLRRMKDFPADHLVQNVSSNRSLEERILTARVLINRMALVPENIKHSDYSFLSENGFEKFRATLAVANRSEELAKLFPVLLPHK